VSQRLTRADVERIAVLARLELTDAEKDLFVRQLTEVLEYADQIQAVDTTGVPPTSHMLSSQQTERDDTPAPSLPNTEALANAPDRSAQTGLFRVPRVIDQRG
jgi:aspartyl-tRNA(Asn)/glutamyl-tRNA(Gln) amidotransferase subunit C